ncbi:ABC transporter permease [Rhizobium sp. NZLR1b]|uniref:ABC transporter permease n=1 Tax=unclassified Rhizobium TaxID=2613769 RepID=UPI001C83766D|nr:MULTISPECIES: ABC transporter permease [unclassified Rhizobium]MBX5173499.1 ABC transporter permease [Rhizobium sp. NZLR1b]MBX5192706.1 ABC transporter permease [Rhizobium sp. NZLR3b]
MSVRGETKTVLSTDAPDRITKTKWSFRELWKRYGAWGITAVNLTCFFLIWEAFVRMGFVNELFLPKASDMFSALWQGLTTSAPPGASVSGSIRDHLFFTLGNLGIGLVIACVLGIPAGLLMGGNKYVETILSPYIWALASVPRVALVPLFILLLGFTVKLQVTIVVLSAIFPIIINSWAGVKTTDKSLLAAARVFGANRWELYTKVVLPFTLPFIIAGVQQGIGRGLVGVVIAEIFGGSSGLGYLIKRAADTFNSSLMYSVLFVLVVVSLGLVQATRWLESYVAPWRRIDSL